jgi:hypothetical protein
MTDEQTIPSTEPEVTVEAPVEVAPEEVTAEGVAPADETTEDSVDAPQA